MHNKLSKYTNLKLTSHFENNLTFKAQFYFMEEYYLSKFIPIIKETDQDEFISLFNKSVKSQYYTGYYMIRELLEIEGTNLDEGLTQLEGYLTEEIPHLIKQATGHNFDEAIISEDMQKMILWGITKYEDIRTLLKQTAFDIVCLGAKQALLDERDNKGMEKEENHLKGLIGSIYDYDFIVPQLFLGDPLVSEGVELWPVMWWSSIKEDSKQAGEVIIGKFNTDGESYYQLKIYLKSVVSEREMQYISTMLLTRMMENNIERDKITLSLAVVDDFYTFVQENQSA